MEKRIINEVYDELNTLYQKYESKQNIEVCKDISEIKKIIEKKLRI